MDNIMANALAWAAVFENSPMYRVISSLTEAVMPLYLSQSQIPREQRRDDSLSLLLNIICISHEPDNIRYLVSNGRIDDLREFEKPDCITRRFLQVSAAIEELHDHPEYSSTWLERKGAIA